MTHQCDDCGASFEAQPAGPVTLSGSYSLKDDDNVYRGEIRAGWNNGRLWTRCNCAACVARIEAAHKRMLEES